MDNQRNSDTQGVVQEVKANSELGAEIKLEYFQLQDGEQ